LPKRLLNGATGSRYDHRVRRSMTTCVAVLLACGLAASGVAAGAVSNPLARVSPPSGGYSVELPRTWRFANASYPSDHATHLWFDPANALRKMLVVLSGCAGCAQKNGHPDPEAAVPAGATSVRRLSPSTAAFQDFTPDDPWVANGIAIVVRQNGAIDGYVTVELWLPASRHALATTILNSLRLDS
jgi:hypothetical protein